MFKQCQTLADHYEVYCALPNADPDVAPAIHFIRLPFFRRVVWRALFTSPYVLLRGLWLRPAIVHLYVPEFIPFAFVFRWLGAEVIYEVQENLYKKLHLKTPNRGRLLNQLFRYFDQLARRHFYLIFTEHGYLDTYTDLARPYAVIYNFPSLPFLETFRRPYQPNPNQPFFFYIGWISFERAFDTLLDGLAQLRTVVPRLRVELYGTPAFALSELETLPAYHDLRDCLHFHGYTDQRVAFEQIDGATAGLALLKPVGDYPDSYPTKLFEYMALGLPVITSDFPLYRDVVERHQCGFCVSAHEPAKLAEALLYLIQHPEQARQMGARGQRAVETYYNWASEAQKLLTFYKLIGRQGH